MNRMKDPSPVAVQPLGSEEPRADQRTSLVRQRTSLVRRQDHMAIHPRSGSGPAREIALGRAGRAGFFTSKASRSFFLRA